MTIQLKEKQDKEPTYQEFDYKIHDTDKTHYWISAKCSNCRKDSQIAVKKGIKVNNARLSMLKCPFCELQKTLFHVEWDGKKYVRVDNGN